MSDRIHDRISASPTVDHAEPETMPRAGTGPTTAMYISGNVFRRAAGSDLLGGQPIPEPTLGILRRQRLARRRADHRPRGRPGRSRRRPDRQCSAWGPTPDVRSWAG